MRTHDERHPRHTADLRSREEKRRLKRLERKRQHEEKTLAMKIAIEERKMLIAHRKLESMRLLEELFNRVKVKFTILFFFCFEQ